MLYLSQACIIKIAIIVMTAANFNEGKLPESPMIRPNAIENKKPTNIQIEKTPLFLEERPIDIEYIAAVIDKVASVGAPFIFHVSRKRGSKGTNICKIIHVTNSVVSAEISLICLCIIHLKPHIFL